MAAENSAYIWNALSQIIQPSLHRQWNRTAFLLALLNSTPQGITEGSGKNTQFDVEFTGATAQTVAEGADVPSTEYASDVDVPITFPWCTYRSSFQLSEQELDMARGSIGTPDEIRNLLEPRIIGAATSIASQMENDLLVGTGVDANGNPAFVGIFGGAITASGLYGGVNAATYTEWTGNVLANGGTARTLTPDLLENADAQVFLGASEPWDVIMTSAGVTRKYASMFTNSGATGLGFPVIRLDPTSGKYDMGAATGMDGQQENITYKGKRVIRNRLNPTGKLAMLNTRHLALKHLPHRPSEREKEWYEKVGLKGQSGTFGPVQATNLPARITVLGKTGDNIKLSLRVTAAFCCVRRNAQAVVQDLSEV
jgi:hypothetical protein